MTSAPIPGDDPVVRQLTKLASAGLLAPGQSLELIAARAIAVGDTLPRPTAGVLARWRGLVDRLGAPPAVSRSLDRIEHESALVVVTGQQAGVLGGPSLSILKAVHAIRLARDLERRLSRPVVPLFWIASDDHDLGELHSVHVVNHERQVQRVRLDLPDGGLAASEVEAPACSADFVRRVFEIAGLDETSDLAASVQPEAGERLGHWFGRVLLRVLGEHGIVPLEPSVLLPDAGPLFRRALDGADSCNAALKQGFDGVRAQGLEPPLSAEVDSPLFLIDASGRSRCVRDGEGRWAAGGRRLPATIDELLGPGLPRLSADASLRPVLQNAALPALAYVAGPTEVVYWAQLGPLHEALTTPFPPVVPRLEVSFLPRRLTRLMRKQGLGPLDLWNRLGAAPSGSPTPGAFEEGVQLRSELEAWAARLAALDPSVRQAASRRSDQLLRGLDRLLEQSEKAWSERLKRALEGSEWIEAYLRPRQQGQDRVLNFLPFFHEGGAALIDRLLGLDPWQRRWIVSVTP